MNVTPEEEAAMAAPTGLAGRADAPRPLSMLEEAEVLGDPGTRVETPASSAILSEVRYRRKSICPEGLEGATAISDSVQQRLAEAEAAAAEGVTTLQFRTNVAKAIYHELKQTHFNMVTKLKKSMHHDGMTYAKDLFDLEDKRQAALAKLHQCKDDLVVAMMKKEQAATTIHEHRVQVYEDTKEEMQGQIDELNRELEEVYTAYHRMQQREMIQGTGEESGSGVTSPLRRRAPTQPRSPATKKPVALPNVKNIMYERMQQRLREKEKPITADAETQWKRESFMEDDDDDVLSSYPRTTPATTFSEPPTPLVETPQQRPARQARPPKQRGGGASKNTTAVPSEVLRSQLLAMGREVRALRDETASIKHALKSAGRGIFGKAFQEWAKRAQAMRAGLPIQPLPPAASPTSTASWRSPRSEQVGGTPPAMVLNDSDDVETSDNARARHRGLCSSPRPTRHPSTVSDMKMENRNVLTALGLDGFSDAPFPGPSGGGMLGESDGDHGDCDSLDDMDDTASSAPNLSSLLPLLARATTAEIEDDGGDGGGPETTGIFNLEPETRDGHRYHACIAITKESITGNYSRSASPMSGRSHAARGRPGVAMETISSSTSPPPPSGSPPAEPEAKATPKAACGKKVYCYACGAGPFRDLGACPKCLKILYYGVAPAAERKREIVATIRKGYMRQWEAICEAKRAAVSTVASPAAGISDALGDGDAAAGPLFVPPPLGPATADTDVTLSATSHHFREDFTSTLQQLHYNASLGHVYAQHHHLGGQAGQWYIPGGGCPEDGCEPATPAGHAHDNPAGGRAGALSPVAPLPQGYDGDVEPSVDAAFHDQTHTSSTTLADLFGTTCGSTMNNTHGANAWRRQQRGKGGGGGGGGGSSTRKGSGTWGAAKLAMGGTGGGNGPASTAPHFSLGRLPSPGSPISPLIPPALGEQPSAFGYFQFSRDVLPPARGGGGDAGGGASGGGGGKWASGGTTLPKTAKTKAARRHHHQQAHNGKAERKAKRQQQQQQDAPDGHSRGDRVVMSPTAPPGRPSAFADHVRSGRNKPTAAGDGASDSVALPQLSVVMRKDVGCDAGILR